MNDTKKHINHDEHPAPQRPLAVSELPVSEIQRQVDEWITQFKTGYFHPLSNLARLVEEVGELARCVNHLQGDKPPKQDSHTTHQDLIDEFGDVLFTLAALANQLNVDLEESIIQVFKKINQRDAGKRYEYRNEEGSSHPTSTQK